MFRTMKDQERAVEAAAVENAKRETIAQVYAKLPTVFPCDANSRMIICLIEEWAGPNVIPTSDLFFSMLDENPGALTSLATRPVEKTKSQIIEDILSLLKSKNEGRDGKFDDWALRSEEKRMQSWSLDALRNRLNEIRTRQKMSAAPVASLKAMVADAHRDQSVNGYPVLPTALWDGSKHVKVDADYLNHLVKTDMWQFKKLVRLYGSFQIDRTRGIK